MTRCDRCGQEKPSVTLQPTFRQLLFGGYPVRQEYRCDECEKTVTKAIVRHLVR